jgi:hypothetical protein
MQKEVAYSGGRDRRIVVQGQTGQMLARPYLKQTSMHGGSHICGPSYLGGGVDRGGSGKSVRSYLKKRKLKVKGLGRGVAQVVEHLLSKLRALISIPSTAKNGKGIIAKTA